MYKQYTYMIVIITYVIWPIFLISSTRYENKFCTSLFMNDDGTMYLKHDLISMWHMTQTFRHNIRITRVWNFTMCDKINNWIITGWPTIIINKFPSIQL